LESDAQRPRRRSSAAAAAGDDDFKLVVFKIGNADFDLAARAWVRDFDLAGDAVELEEGGMASETVAVTALDSDSAFVECCIIRRLAMLLVGWGSLSAEKKARWRGHWIICAGLLWKPCAGWRTGEVELPDKNSGASWNEVRCR
jgi:hypothetical protein